MYLYLKALHIIFVVTWFAGLFYIPRLFIYSTEAETQPEVTRDVLRAQFSIMMRRLWYGITFPSAIITFILGHIVLYLGNWHLILLEPEGRWLLLKYIFVWLLYGYHYSLHLIFKQIQQNIFRYSSQQLRIWNEVATIFLFAIVFLVVVKQSMSLVWGMLGLASFISVLMSAIYIYKRWRKV
jgi:putative membrane protein